MTLDWVSITYTISNTNAVAAFDERKSAGTSSQGSADAALAKKRSGDVTAQQRATSAPQSSINQTRVRLQSVSTSSGYQLHYNYQIDTIDNPDNAYQWNKLTSIQAINTAIDPCGIASPRCAGLTQTAAAVSFVSGSGMAGSTPITTYTVTDPLGRNTIYGSASGLFTVQRPGSNTQNYSYTLDGLGRATQLVADGQNWTYAFSTPGSGLLTITMTDPLGHASHTTADLANQQLSSSTDENGYTTNYGYDANGRLTRITMPEGVANGAGGYTTYTYDGRGNITQTVATAVGGGSTLTTSATFSTSCTNLVTCNKPTTTTNARGNATAYTYDPTHGGVLTVTSPAPTAGAVMPQMRYSYTALQAYYNSGSGTIVPSGVPVYRLTGASTCRTMSSCAGTTDETKTTITYGSIGVVNNLLLTAVGTAAGNGSPSATTALTYTVQGDVTAVDGPLPGTADTTHYYYSIARELGGVVGPDPDGSGPLKYRELVYHYTGADVMDSVSVGTSIDVVGSTFTPLRITIIGYDTALRKTMETLYDGSGNTIYALTQYRYDAAGRLLCVTERMNPATFGSEPSDACMLGTTGSYGPDRITHRIIEYGGLTDTVQTGYGTPLQRNEIKYTHTLDGQVATVRDADGNVTTYNYDGFDRLYQTKYPNPTGGGSSTNDVDKYSHDDDGNITLRIFRDGTSVTYTYDTLDRLTAVSLPSVAGSNNANPSYAYDNLGHLTAASNGNGVFTTSTTFGYDALGRRTSEANAYNGGCTAPVNNCVMQTMQYDAAGRRTQLTWNDGFSVSYDYDNVGEMTAIRENGATSGVGVLAAFGYDDLGQRTTLTRGNGTSTSYGYDAASRLTSLSQDLGGTAADLTITLGNYSPAGEIGTHTASNDAYAWTEAANTNRGYNVNGLNQYTAVGGTTPTYDARGNTTFVGSKTYGYDSLNELTTGDTTRFDYDALQRHIYNNAASSWFVHDGDEVIAEYTASGTLKRRYVFGPGTDEPLVWYEGTGTSDRRWLHADERGSTIALSDGNGAKIAIDAYDEYGKPQSTNIGLFQYTGQAYVSTLGMYDYKARFYSPSLGRFLQTDPIGYGNGPNWYNYVHGDPINLIDPSGLDDCGDGSGDICVTAPSGAFGGGGGGSGGGGSGDPSFLIHNGQVVRPSIPLLPQNNQTHTCPKGSRVTASIGGSATGAFLYVAVSVGAEVGVSLPTNFFSTGSLRGLQFYGSVSFQGLGGLGFFAGAGATPSVGYSNGPIQSGASGSHVVGGGAALGVGGEASVATNGSGGSVSGGPEAGVGAYAGYGGKVSGTAATPQIGCTP